MLQKGSANRGLQKEENWKKSWKTTADYSRYCYSEIEILEVMQKAAVKKKIKVQGKKILKMRL